MTAKNRSILIAVQQSALQLHAPNKCMTCKIELKLHFVKELPSLHTFSQASTLQAHNALR